MENKCSDQIAAPSIYGRTEDIVGNSIPGFVGGKYFGTEGYTATRDGAKTGGFPEYDDVGATPGKANKKLLM